MSDTTPVMSGGCTTEQYASVLKALHGDSAAATALCQVFATTDRTEEIAHGLNTVFMVLSGALVFIMHGGFAMLEAGAIRSKNAMNILLQTVLDGAASAIMWYLVGFGFAYGIGDNPNGFIGDALFALSRYVSHETVVGKGDWTSWFFQWAFCATAATIPAGAVAERFNFNAYLGYSAFLGGFVYPVVVHWVWCRTGWLGYGTDKPLLGAGMIDFAGSGVVHMTGGLAGLIGAWMVGPRMGRFDANGQPVAMPGHSAILVVLGTVMLWFGWYGFNPGSALVADTMDSARIAGRAAVTTTLSGAASGLTCLSLSVVRHKSWDLTSLCNGMLVGFVSITAGCTVVEPWAALLCGGIAAVLFEGGCTALLRLRIDDVVSAGPMHGFCGAWGLIFVGFLAKEDYVRQTYDREVYPYGLFYGGGGKLLASQVIGFLSIAGWVAGTMGPFFAAFRFARSLRISAEHEAMGLDASKHGGSAYNIPMHRFTGALMSANVLSGENSNRGIHLTMPYSNGDSRAVGDAIMRAATYGGVALTNAIGGGGGGGGGGNMSINHAVPLYGSFNGVLATSPMSPHTLTIAGMNSSSHNRIGNVGPDSSVGSEDQRMFQCSPAVRQQSSCLTAPVPVADEGLGSLTAAASGGKEVTSLSEDRNGGRGVGGVGGKVKEDIDLVLSGRGGASAGGDSSGVSGTANDRDGGAGSILHSSSHHAAVAAMAMTKATASSTARATGDGEKATATAAGGMETPVTSEGSYGRRNGGANADATNEVAVFNVDR